MSSASTSTGWMTGIDHPVIAVRNMAAAHTSYERLGFTVPPRGSHLEWGTGNWCIMFEHDYVELRGIVKEGHTHNLDEFLKTRGEGLMGLALGTDDAAASHAELAKRGFHPRPVTGLTRNFELPEGWLQPRFSLCFLEEPETAGLMSVVFCQHLTPELIRRPEWWKHKNAAVAVASLTGAVSSVDEAVQMHARLFGKDAIERNDDCLSIDTGRGRIVLGAVAKISRRYPEAAELLRGGPRLVAITLKSSDLEQTAAVLSGRGVSMRRGTKQSIIVPPSECCGVVMEFVQA
jgi:catechol 2,3-dioxygenase-like lactoylglutathione lyase family enzyme